MAETEEFDWLVRRELYDVTMRRGTPPTVAELSAALDLPQEETERALERLAAGRVVVLQPGSHEILMANPFSAIPTPFLVELDGVSCFGNCIWDALGIPAMLGQDARIRSSCGDCGAAMELRVAGGQVEGDEGVIHFAIPAHRWWADIVFN